MKTIQFVLTAQVPDDEDEAVVERRIDRMLENSYDYDCEVDQVNLKALHAHVYDETSTEDDNLVEEVDLPLQGKYDNYLQYGFHLDASCTSCGSKWIEIRVMKEGGD